MTDAEERDSTTPRRRTAGNNKRASGESSIYRDEDGRWHRFVSMGKKENGRRDRRHVSGAKRADVVAKVRAIEAKRDAGVIDAAGRAPTVGEWLDHWLDNIAARKVRARTLESYRSTVRLHLRPGIGHHRLDRLQPEHLERLYGALSDKGLSPASILRAHRVLSRALRVASQRAKVARNVATLVDPPTVKRPKTALPLSAQEARKVMDAAQTHRNAARWTVALAVGLRQSEALALRWSDVDLANGTLSVRRGLHRISGRGLVYEEPKADHSRRNLALPAQLVDALKAQRAAQLEERIAAGPLWEDHDLVFAQPNGRPIERKSDWRAWKTLLRQASVREVRLHDGRHTTATLLLSEGVHPRVVMEVLGHAQMRTTTDTYSHVMPTLGRDAANRMGQALWD
ncbi:site-specific integrase [Geodermatophilus sp. TF02-6]|uniref:tyrosine-type recombinase/integrase n=1 Tax=Geodermatophilus sp. TF02-6 TaxID=2250575 RepID=UPI000DE88C06|nr:tyrosine-type recombinase/integrase [Geodermatophilus sp. TF02-6]RBY74608.1 site-specific integrase [Geodermatophilus sp. TF02-6]